MPLGVGLAISKLLAHTDPNAACISASQPLLLECCDDRLKSAQYVSIAYRQILADRDITISMSRPGNPFDNAKAESFMKTLKAEEVNGKAFSDIRDARRRIDSFIADVYNKERLHSALGYQYPLSSKPRSRKTKHDNPSSHPLFH